MALSNEPKSSVQVSVTGPAASRPSISTPSASEIATTGIVIAGLPITVANRNLKGLWKDMPIFINDLSAMSWA